MAGLEVDGLEYDAEVAYITATSPVLVNGGNRASKTSFSEFEFSGEMPIKVEPAREPQASSVQPSWPNEAEKLVKASAHTERSHDETQGKKVWTSPFLDTSFPSHGSSSDHLSPLHTPPHYTLDTTPSRIKRPQEAQASPPALKPSTPKFQVELENAQYQYKTIVIYGQPSSSKAHLVEKLVHSNPAMIAKVVPSTTRKRSANEVAGVDFHYISQREMSQGIESGDFLEYSQVQRHSRKLLKRGAISEQDLFNKISKKTDSPSIVDQRKKSSSKSDLLEDGSPLASRELIGTTKQALVEATQQGKPCIVLNVGMIGALHLKKKGIKAIYILIHLDTKPLTSDRVGPDLVIDAAELKEAYQQLQGYVMQHVEHVDHTQTATNFDIAKREWETLPTVNLELKSTEPSTPPAQTQIRAISFSEVLSHFQGINFSKEKEQAKAELPKKRGFNRPKLNKKLQDERLLMLVMSKCQIRDRDSVYLRMLQTIYIKLTSRNITCRRIGSHWQTIGFTSVDPADDLQDVGALGLVQLIYFLDSPRTMPLAREIYQYTKQKAVPFCKTSLEVTKVTLTALRGGFLTKIANKRDQLVLVTNDFYVATFYRLFNTLKSQVTPTVDSRAALCAMCDSACKHAQDILKDFSEYQTKKEHSKKAPSSLVETTPKPFTQLDDYSDV